MIVLAAVLAGLVGIALGVLGGGGSILIVPIFTYALGYDAKEAIAMSLGVVGVTSLVGAFGYWQLGQVNVRLGLVFAVGAMSAAFVGARLAGLVSGAVQLTLLALVMLLAAAFMLRGRPRGADASGDEGEPAGERLALVPIVLQSSGVGLLTGLLGVGGGFLIVPALTLLAKVPMKRAVGTSLLIIALNALAGFVGYLGQVHIVWDTLVAFTAVTLGGIVVGTLLARHTQPERLRRAFAVFLVVVGAFVLFQNRGVVLSLA
jgi:uncharacterized membrane protein YfcA